MTQHLEERELMFDGGPPSSARHQCLACAHFSGLNWDGSGASCQAFAEIPAGIWSGAFIHTQPYPGDGGVRYLRTL